jgi:hypothetical protein
VPELGNGELHLLDHEFPGTHFCLGVARLRIPTIVTSRSDGSRPPVPIDRDHFGAGCKAP